MRKQDKPGESWRPWWVCSHCGVVKETGRTKGGVTLLSCGHDEEGQEFNRPLGEEVNVGR